MDCPYCGSDVLLHMGFDDGGGGYGDSVCEQWECMECGAAVEGNCFDSMSDRDVWNVDVYGTNDGDGPYSTGGWDDPELIRKPGR